MGKKKILIVCKSFYPENTPRAFRASELAKEFARQGHEVTVLTPLNAELHLPYAQEHGFSIRDMGKLKWKCPDFGNSRIGYLFTRAAVRLLQLSIEYPDIELMFKVKKALKKLSGFDLLISIAVPHPIHWGVAWSRNHKHHIAKIWVADCGDPYMGERTDTFRKWFYFKFVEKWATRKANYVSIPVETGREGYYPEFQQKIRIIPQGFNFDTIITKENFITNKIPTFAYAGGFIPGKRDPQEFLNYLTKVTTDFRFVVYTNSKRLLEPFQAMLGAKLVLNDYIPRNELLEALTQMDFLVNFDNNTMVQLPSKLIDYALVGRPVLNIEKNFDTNTVMQFLSGNYKSAMKMSDISQYRIENVCYNFLELITESL